LDQVYLIQEFMQVVEVDKEETMVLVEQVVVAMQVDLYLLLMEHLILEVEVVEEVSQDQLELVELVDQE
jgi:hypothetical protein